MQLPLLHRNGGASSLLLGYADKIAALTIQESSLKRTPLFELHKQHQALMVPFAGYSMPVKYANMGPLDAHQWVRKNAGIFDVSHMV